MVSTQTKSWMGTGALNFRQQWWTAKTQPTNNTEHVTQNNPSGPDPSGVWENIFHLFLSSASGKYNFSHTSRSHCQADRHKLQSIESPALQRHKQPAYVRGPEITYLASVKIRIGQE